MNKKILVLGGTGAMGVYLVPELVGKGYEVDVVSLDEKTSDNPRLTYIKGDALDDQYLSGLLKKGYDAVVDFLLYVHTEDFERRYKLFLDNTSHYIFLSSYRVYAGEYPITEESPRLLETASERAYLETNDYSLYKARQEDILVNSGYKNWTIVRPAITYSKFRYQLTILEANVLIERMRKGKTVVLPQEAMDIQATMTWAGDVAKMFSAIILNEKAYGERYTLATAEHNTWRTVAEYYKEIGGLKYITVGMEDFLQIMSPDSNAARWQLKYDRMLNRVVDNSKILALSGLKQSDLMPLKEGLKHELSNLPENVVWPCNNEDVNRRMDEYLKKHNM